MTETIDNIRQEAAAMVIDECRQWLTKIVQEEMEKIEEDTKHIADSKQRIEQIVATFGIEPEANVEEEVDRVMESQIVA